MRTALINRHLAKAAYFRQLADPDMNYQTALARDGGTTMLPAKAAIRAQYWEDRAAELVQQGLAQRRGKTRP
tara:strand:+ start:1141 stop:1356 length:216 start_codon:yes stop_codon:yes gene_type:complete